MSKYRFNTLEELQAVYPIHAVFSSRREVHKDIRYFYNDADLKVLKHHNDNVEVINDNECICTKTVINANIVEGYIFDGEYWYPAYVGHDGWDTLDEYDIFKEEEIIYDSTRYYHHRRDYDRVI